MLESASAVSIPWRAPTNTVLPGSSFAEGQRTKLESVTTQGMTCTSLLRILRLEILKYQLPPPL